MIESSYVYELSSKINLPLKKFCLHAISRKKYIQLMDDVISEILYENRMNIDFPSGAYETNRKKKLYAYIANLQNHSPIQFIKIDNKINDFLNHLNSIEDYFEYYLLYTLPIHNQYRAQFKNVYEDYDFHQNIEESSNSFLFMMENILIFVDFCFITRDVNYISIITAVLWYLGFDLNVKVISLSNIFKGFKSICYGQPFKIDEINNSTLSVIHRNLLWINEKIYNDLIFFDTIIAQFKVEYKSEHMNLHNNKIVCPCCFYDHYFSKKETKTKTKTKKKQKQKQKQKRKKM